MGIISTLKLSSRKPKIYIINKKEICQEGEEIIIV